MAAGSGNVSFIAGLAAMLLACGPADPLADAGRDAGISTCDTIESCALTGCAGALICVTCNGACSACERCQLGRCMPLPEASRCGAGTCHEGACCETCWDGTACQPGDAPTACGGGGGACARCEDPLYDCVEGSCALAIEVGVAAGGEITCSIGASELLCSGQNGLGQLGIETMGVLTTPTLIPTGLGRIVAVDATDGYSCFLARDGTLGCSGANNFGQLGTNDTSDRASVLPVDGTTRFEAVSAGPTHACAIGLDGGLFCWGNNFYGQLGLGDTGPRRRPSRVGIDTDWRDVGVGIDHTCAIKGDGELWCFGNGAVGQLGDGDRLPQSIPQRIGDGYAQLDAGALHTCAVRTDGTLVCWGGGSRGQLGLGDTMLRRAPTQVGTLSDWVEVSAGAGHTCAVRRDGTVQCFGENDDGELGASTGGMDSLVPVAVEGLAGVMHVHVGSDHSCATVMGSGGADNTAQCWGTNRSGQLGAPSPEMRTTPGPYPP